MPVEARTANAEPAATITRALAAIEIRRALRVSIHGWAVVRRLRVWGAMGCR